MPTGHVPSIAHCSLERTVTAGRAFIPWMYTLSLPPLMLIRWFQYKKRKWTYFMLDFCYVADLLLWINMIFLPQSKYLFLVIFSVGCGPLAGAVIMYRNSLVFHSIDKFSSAYIRTFPFRLPLLANELWPILRWK